MASQLWRTAQSIGDVSAQTIGAGNYAMATSQDWSKQSGKLFGIADIVREGWLPTAMQRASGNMREILAGMAPEVGQLKRSFQQQRAGLALLPQTSADPFLREWLARKEAEETSTLMARGRESALASLAGAEQAYSGRGLEAGNLAAEWAGVGIGGYGTAARGLAEAAQVQAKAAEEDARRRANKLSFWGSIGKAIGGAAGMVGLPV